MKFLWQTRISSTWEHYYVRSSPKLQLSLYRVSTRAFWELVSAAQIHKKKSQEPFEAKRHSKIVAIFVLRSVTSQSCYRSYRYPYTIVLLRRSHHCLFCPPRAPQENQEGCGGKKIMPQLLNKEFSAKATTKILKTQTCQVTLILRVRPAFWPVNQHSLAENLN